MKITALYRHHEIYNDQSKPTDIRNPGGGSTTKAYHLSKALPNVQMMTEVDPSSDICLVEVLWFSELGGENMERRIADFTNLNALKILIFSDVEIFRVSVEVREQILDAVDIITAVSKYNQQLVEAFADKPVMMWYDPIDIDQFVPSQKGREICGIGHINPEKNVGTIANIFRSLPDDAGLIKTYIGSRNVWGENHREATSKQIEKDLMGSCDYFENKIPRAQIPKRLGPIWGYVSDTRYDFSSYSMLEAMLCGCWLFCGRHLMFDERPCERFETVDGAVDLIRNRLEASPPESGQINEEARQYVIDHCSYDVFRRQFKELIGEHILGNL